MPASEVASEMKVSLPSQILHITSKFYSVGREELIQSVFTTDGDENETHGAQLAEVSLFENNNC